MIVLLIIGTIICVFGIIVFWYHLVIKDSNKNNCALGLVISSILTFACLISLVLKCNTIPEAIDVYRGKTELKIRKEIIDNSVVKCDSIVVFKDNKK